MYTIDDENCIKCELCVKSCDREAIDLTMEDEEIEVPVGAIVIATGYELFDVSQYHRLGYGRFKNVINALEYERLINAAGPTHGNLMRLSDGKIPKSLGFVQCVGARDVKKDVPYCSRVCCMYGVKNAVMAKELQHDNVKNVTIYYADIRAYGKGFEEFTNMAKTRFGIKFIRGRVGEVEENSKTKNVTVWAENTETGDFLRNEHEMLVLCPGILPPAGLKELAANLGLEVGVDGFIPIQYPASNPVDTIVSGVYVAGCAESAKDIPDSVAAGSAAAMRASIILARGGEP